MKTTTVLLIALCGLNLAALAGVLLAGRRRPGRAAARPPAAPFPDAGDAPRVVRRPEAAPTLDDLVAEAEATERLTARGESRLAADLARWRDRGTGRNVPPAASDRRPAAGGHAW